MPLAVAIVVAELGRLVGAGMEVVGAADDELAAPAVVIHLPVSDPPSMLGRLRRRRCHVGDVEAAKDLVAGVIVAPVDRTAFVPRILHQPLPGTMIVADQQRAVAGD